MTRDEAEKIMAAVMGKCEENCLICLFDVLNCSYIPTPKDWQPCDSQGRMIGEVIDFMQKELPEWWNAFLVKMTRQYYWEDVSGTKYLTTKLFNAQLSLTFLAEFIRKEYKKMFYQECPNHGFDKYFIEPCEQCNGTGIIPIPRFKEAIRVIEEDKP